MQIQMAGIDFNKAPVAVRERFSLTKSAAGELMQEWALSGNVDGCVLLQTCNRTELWVSGTASPFELLCQANGLEPEAYRDICIARSGHDAVRHLFALACGMKSQVFGEDQIITQVGDAAADARALKTSDSVLESLFRMAVTSAKKIKTQVRINGVNTSVATQLIACLQEQNVPLADAKCLVIGNGEMGRLAARALHEAGAKVYMTVRQYHKGEVLIPEGIQPIGYEQRKAYLPQMQVVVSATASPHYTIRKSDIGVLAHPVIFCDLAVPRDIEPEISCLANAKVYDTDGICGTHNLRIDGDALETAGRIMQEEIQAFENWYQFRGLVPIVHEISKLAADDVAKRMEKPIHGLPLEKPEQERLSLLLEEASGKAVSRMMYGLREHLDPALWQSCMEGLRKSAQKET